MDLAERDADIEAWLRQVAQPRRRERLLRPLPSAAVAPVRAA